MDKQLKCPQTGEVVDRDANAARNLRDWPDHASCGPVRATAPSVPGPTETSVGTGHGADAGTSAGADGASVRPRPAGPEAARPEPNRRQRRGGTPQGDAA
jgi:putative transposase